MFGVFESGHSLQNLLGRSYLVKHAPIWPQSVSLLQTGLRFRTGSSLMSSLGSVLRDLRSCLPASSLFYAVAGAGGPGCHLVPSVSGARLVLTLNCKLWAGSLHSA